VTARLMVEQPATPIELVDTVGAGDSFTAGLLDGLAGADLLGGDRREALAAVGEAMLRSVLDDAGRVAAITCSRPGSDPSRTRRWVKDVGTSVARRGVHSRTVDCSRAPSATRAPEVLPTGRTWDVSRHVRRPARRRTSR
jgi:hypothetical protein